ncbi:class I SAM-dependent methyltransferase [Ochrovirga pacifica]|uniref:class I SAM-dependent methyltransferase n=1 Tax=Ochrovirga pacifica TaxID=1042376 RepID=UPI0002559FE0|nr:methyltransferase domain-containing protein [Ochrovirga pacifica]
MSHDVLGNALIDYYKQPKDQTLITFSSVAEKDSMPVSYFFRTFDEMPSLEQKALELCSGNILDVGLAAGCHALYLQNKGFKVTGIDISKGATNVAQQRGVRHVIKGDVLNTLLDEKFDTVLVLMNGTGICGKLSNLANFLLKLAELLNSGGQILIDSSDIIYMYEDENGEHWIDASQAYYGEVAFTMSYQNQTSETFDWLYVDYNTLQRCAIYNGLQCELIQEGEHYDYLAKITKD